MNKKEYLRRNVESDLWSIFKRVYEIKSAIPMSEKQENLLKEISDYVYNNFACKFTRNELEKILKETRDDRTRSL